MGLRKLIWTLRRPAAPLKKIYVTLLSCHIEVWKPVELAWLNIEIPETRSEILSMSILNSDKIPYKIEKISTSSDNQLRKNLPQ